MLRSAIIKNAPKGVRCISSTSRYHGNLATSHIPVRNYKAFESIFNISEEVKAALITRKPIVALETTIYTHGFPSPENYSLALELEKEVRANGGVPATIGVLDGVIRVGFNAMELETLCSSAGHPDTMKISRRDIPYITGMGMAGRKLNGGTTIAGTMFIAAKTGIKVFGTGGLGGVHRGGQDTMDISADLTELGRTGVAVISSGCKSFLDLPRTLEFLETQGVPVSTFADGRTGEIEIPSFYTRESGIKSPLVVQNATEAAAMILAGMKLQTGSGMFFANPIPEEFSIPKSEIDAVIDQAVNEAAKQGFSGHANTPFILSRIKELTKGNSIPANTALIRSNVIMATKVAVELGRLYHKHRSAPQLERETYIPNVTERSGLIGSRTSSLETITKPNQVVRPKVVVFGSVAVDLACDYSPSPAPASSNFEPQMKTSNIAAITQSVGGVGHNVALAAHRVAGSLPIRLCSLIGGDLAGVTALDALKQEGLDISNIITVPDQRTAQYVSINDGNKDLVLAMADMSIISNAISESQWIESNALSASWAVVDGNWSSNEIRNLLSTVKKMKNINSTKTIFEPVSVPKSASLFLKGPSNTMLRPFPRHWVDLVTPNQHELAAMHSSAKQNDYFESDEWWKIIDSFGIPSTGARDRFVAITNPRMTDEGIPLQTIQLLPFIPTILTKLGPDGVLLTELLKPDDPRLRDPDHARYILSRCSNGSTEVSGVYMRLFPAVEVVEDVVSVNGVGDTFLGVLVAGLAKGLELNDKLIDIAQRGAVMTLRSKEAVSPDLGVLVTELDSLNK